MYSNKIALDKFYTKEEVAKQCVKCIDLASYDFVIEPSAGSGAFLKAISHKNVLGIDIEPEIPSIKKMSWFDYQIPSEYKNVLVIGNPPFGKRNLLSKQFIHHASNFANVRTIAFILPDVYNKHTLQKAVPIDFKLKSVTKLPDNSFLINGTEYHVNCSFFVFDKLSDIDLRFDAKKYQETNHWKYATPDDYDFYVMGASPQTVKDVPTETNRGYYIKVKPPIKVSEVKLNFQKLNIKGFSSVKGGAFWMTKPELVKVYMETYFP